LPRVGHADEISGVASGSHGCQHSNVGTRRNYQYMFRFTSNKLLMARNTFIQLTTAANSPCSQLAAWSTHRDYLCLWHNLKS
ncbi:hypothetical protein T05_8939, partial [Trichinella murrelli]